MPGSDIFFYAQWNVNSYSLAYDVNGGTGSTPTTQTANYLSSVTVATPSLTRAGWSFVGWNTAANGTGTQFAPGGSFTFGAASVTLYAEWTRNVNAVIFDAVGGASAPAVRFGATGTSVTLPNEVPLREGYTFVNWEDSTQATHNPGATLTMPASSMTLFARWSINSYLLTYDANGGTGSLPTSQSIQFSSAVTVSAASVTRSSFTFARWNTAQDGSGTSYDINASFAMPARPVTLYAQWTPVVTTTTTTTTVPATVVVQKPTTRPSVTTTTSTTSTTSTTTTSVPEIEEPVVVEDADQQTTNNLWVFVMAGVVLLGAALLVSRKLKRKL
jgi:uncharacterized repeat protein (TIGR02543 family)